MDPELMHLLAQAPAVDELWNRLIVAAVSALLGVAGAMLTSWYNRRGPVWIEVRDVEASSLVNVAKSLRDKVAVTLDGYPVQTLSQIEVAITNTSLDPIKDIKLLFSYSEPTSVLECELSGVEAEKKIVPTAQLVVTIPLLNSNRHHGDVLTAKIMCDGDASAFAVSGRGEGWSARRFSLDAAYALRMGTISWIGDMSAILAVVYSGIGIVLKQYDIHLKGSDSIWWFILPLQFVLLRLAMTFSSTHRRMRVHH